MASNSNGRAAARSTCANEPRSPSTRDETLCFTQLALQHIGIILLNDPSIALLYCEFTTLVKWHNLKLNARGFGEM